MNAHAHRPYLPIQHQRRLDNSVLRHEQIFSNGHQRRSILIQKHGGKATIRVHTLDTQLHIVDEVDGAARRCDNESGRCG